MRVALAIATLYFLYFGVANLLLVSGVLERMMSKNPIKNRTSWESAWTFIPGHVEVRGFAMTGQTVRNQFLLKIEKGAVVVRLLDLARFRFHATEVQASGLSYKMRRQHIEGGPAPPGRRFEPIIRGMPEFRPELELLKPKKRRFPWVIDLDNVVAENVHEIWMAAYRLVSDGRLVGDMEFELGGELDIPRFALELPSSEVFTGTTKVGEELEIRMTGLMGPCPVRGRRLLDLLIDIETDFTMTGQVADFGFLNLFFGNLPWFSLHGGGQLVADVNMLRGTVSDGSTIEFSSPRLSVALADLEIGGQAEVKMQVDGKHEATLDAMISGIGTGVAADSAQKTKPMSLAVVATASIKDVTHAFSDLYVTLDLPECDIPDLADFNRLIPKEAAINFLPDSKAMAKAHLELTESSGGGELMIVGENIGVDINDLLIAGDLSLDLVLDSIDPTEAEFDIAGTSLRIDSVEIVGGSEKIDADWWLKVGLNEAILDLNKPVTINSDVEIAMRDSLPLIVAFAPPDKRHLLATLLMIRDLNAQADIHLNQRMFELKNIEISGTGLGGSLLGGGGSTVHVASDGIVFGEGFKGLQLEMALSETEIPDLSLINAFLPEAAGFEFEPGASGVAEGYFMAGSGRAAGSVSLSAEAAQFVICNLPVGGDFGVDLQMFSNDFQSLALDVSGSRFWFEEVRSREEDSAENEPWSGYIVVDEGRTDNDGTVSVEASVTAWLANTRLLLSAYMPGKHSGLGLEDLLNIDDVRIRAVVSADQQTIVLSHLGIAGRGTVGGYLQGPGFTLEADDLVIDAKSGIKQLNLEAKLPQSKFVDLSVFNRFIPETSAIAFEAGSSGSVEAYLEIVDGVAQGIAMVEADGIGVDLGHTTMAGDLSLRLNLSRGDIEAQQYAVDGTWLTVKGARFDQERDDDWWARIDLARGEVSLQETLDLNTLLYLEMGDSYPLIGMMTSGKSGDWLSGILNFSEVVGSLGLSMNDEAITISELEIRGLGQTSAGIFGPGMKIEASGSEIHLDQGLKGLQLTLDLPESEIHDLSFFNRYLSESAGLTFLSEGRGSIGAHLELGSSGATGSFFLKCTTMGVQLGSTEIRGDLDLRVEVGGWDLESSELMLTDAGLSLENVKVFRNSEEVHDHWSASLHLPGAHVRMDYPMGISADAEVILEDSWPFADWAAQRHWLARLFKRKLIVESIHGTARIEANKDGVIFDSIAFSGDGFEAMGEFGLFDGSVEGLLFMALGRLEIAVGLDDDKRKWKLFHSRKWYEQMNAED